MSSRMSKCHTCHAEESIYCARCYGDLQLENEILKGQVKMQQAWAKSFYNAAKRAEAELAKGGK